jgi:hypothetical protein
VAAPREPVVSFADLVPSAAAPVLAAVPDPVEAGRLHDLDVSALLFNAAQEVALFATFASLFFSQLITRLFARMVSS